MFSGSKPSLRQTRLVTSPSRPAHSSTSLKCGSALPSYRIAAVHATHRRPVDIVQHAFDQVGRRRQILQALLILDADRVAAEFVGDAQRGDVHLALLEDLGVGQLGLRIRAGVEPHALAVQPLADGLRFVADDIAASRRYSADWLSRSLKTPVGCSSSSGMMALYIPMQPSSKTPMIALFAPELLRRARDRSVPRRFGQFQVAEAAGRACQSC